MDMSGGTISSLDCSWSRPAEYSTWGDVKLELIGTRGVARLDAFRQRVLLANRAGGKLAELCWGDSVAGGLAGAFLRTLRGEAPPAASGEDGLQATAVVEAAYASAREGRPVSI